MSNWTGRRRIAGALALLLLSAACGDEKEGAADAGGVDQPATTATTTSGASAQPATTSGLVFGDTLECDEVISIAEFNSITGFQADHCDALGGFADAEGSTIVSLERFGSEEEAAAESREGEEGLTEDTDRFSGAGWTAYDLTSHGGRALAGDMVVTIRVSGQTDGPLSAIPAEEARRILTELFDLIVSRNG